MAEKVKSLSQKIAEKTIRKLRNMNYGATPVNTSGKENAWDIDKICVTKEGRDLCDINCQTGTISYMNSFDRDEINTILELIKNIREQDEVFTKGPFMEVEGLGRYKILSQYNNVILAACEISTLDYKNQKENQFDYITWEKDKVADGVHAGNYFGENYAAAREDFAKRSGLVNKDKLFSETEMLTIYSGLVKLQDLGDISSNQGKVIDTIKNKINNVLPEIDEKVYQTNPQYSQSEKYQEKYNPFEPDLESSDDNEYVQEI